MLQHFHLTSAVKAFHTVRKILSVPSLSPCLSLTPFFATRQVSSSTLLHDVTRGTRYRFRITLADQWRNLIGGRVIPSSIRASLQTLDVPEKNYRARTRSQEVETVRIGRAVKITRGKNLSTESIATCKDQSLVTLHGPIFTFILHDDRQQAG